MLQRVYTSKFSTSSLTSSSTSCLRGLTCLVQQQQFRSYSTTTFGAHSQSNNTYYDRVDNSYQTQMTSTGSGDHPYGIARGARFDRNIDSPGQGGGLILMPWGDYRDNRGGMTTKGEKRTRDLIKNPGTPRTNLRKKQKVMASIASEYLAPPNANKAAKKK